MNRQATLDQIAQNPDYPVLIVGGGINGISVFRELAAQGLRVLLVDQGDFCSGASAASSHMLHGGIRYLENGEFRLVREALYERNLMLKNAPHQAFPLPTTIPIFSWWSGLLNAPLKFLDLLNKPNERGALVIKIGLIFYDIFARRQRVMPTHQTFSRETSLQKRPDLNPEIVATATYYDAWMPSPERICLELINDAESFGDHARALNYVRLVSGVGDTVRLQDTLSGETLDVRPQLLINAAGPWIDLANRALQKPSRFIGGTKGSHVVVDNPRLLAATGGHEIFFENNDGRIVLLLPFEDRVVMGTTDIHIDNPDEAICTDEEIDYILDLVRKVFPTIEVDRSQIVFTFCGVRPLPASEANAAGQISRDHSIRVIEADSQVHFPVYSLVGGKWTTFRAFGEQTADQVLARLGVSRRVDTAHLPIGGGKNYPASATEQARWLQELSQKSGLALERVQTLFKRYGTDAAILAGYILEQGGEQALQHDPSYSRQEVQFITLREKVAHLDDFILRRSLLAMLGRLNRPLLEELAGIMGECLAWSKGQAAQEVERSIELLRERYLTDIR